MGGNFWNLGGNSGASPGDNFLGTTDNTPLELWVFGARVLRLEPHSTSPNIIGGFSGNWVQTGVFGAAIGGGGENGDENRVANNYGTVAGGRDNRAGEEDYAAVGGGRSNIASGDYSTVPGGRDNVAAGDYSFAVGRRAKADHDGAFVWGDSTNTDIISTGDDQFIIRANGGTQIYGGELAVDNVIHSINGGFRFPDGTEQTTAISLESLMSLIPFWRG